jgi:hypothetical protein
LQIKINSVGARFAPAERAVVVAASASSTAEESNWLLIRRCSNILSKVEKVGSRYATATMTSS